MKRTKRIIPVLLIALASFSAATLLAMSSMPEPEAEPFWAYMAETDPYTKWENIFFL